MSDAGSQASAIEWLRRGDADSLVLTANRRLSRALRDEYDRQMLASGHLAWKTPPIDNWSTWVEHCYAEKLARTDRVRLSAAAAQVLWERVARRHADSALMSVAGLARQANTAWQRLHEWRVPLHRVGEMARGRDEQCFADMLKDYRHELDRQRFADPAEIAGKVIGALENGGIPVPGRILLAGFDRLSPIVEEFRRVAAARGCSVELLGAACPTSRCQRHSYPDDASELRAAGRWARAIAQSDSEATIAIVVSDLEQDAVQTARLVREGFASGWQVGHAGHKAAVEVSYGRRLVDYPAIATALLLLRWVTEGLPSVDLGILIRSPYLRQDDSDSRVALDRRLRRLPARLWSPRDARRVLAGVDGSALPPRWQLVNDAAVAAADEAGQRMALPEWAGQIDAFLDSVGWPGADMMSSDDFQLVNRWRNGLNQLAALETILHGADLDECVRRLTQVLSDVVWQPEGEGVRLRVIGPLEAAGLRFDHLWVARADADRWPPPGRPLPLVSRPLQAECGMPDATPDDTLSYARRVLSRLALSAPDVRFSWSRTDLDATRSPSPLLSALNVVDTGGPPDPGWFASTMVGSGGLRASRHDPVPPIAPGEKVAGGATTIALQRTEPFRAFATGRLQVRELAPFEPGLTAAIRGNLTHNALECLYGDHPAQADLRAWSPAQRQDRVGGAADRAVAGAYWYADDVFRRLLAMERERLVLLLDNVVESDLDRSPFDITGTEERIEFHHAGLVIDLRADRIDRVGDGGDLLVLDYKTGRVRNLVTRDGEPAELQLAVYATALRAPVGGLSLMFVTRHGIQHRAIGSAIDWKPLDADEWDSTLARWRALVLSLAASIAHGDVRVNPRAIDQSNGQYDVLSRVAELVHDR